MKTIEVKQVDLWDGGSLQLFGFYIDPSVPNENIEKAHPHCYIHKHKVLIIFDSLEEEESYKVIEVKRQAWDKLTPLERQALGLRERP